MSNWAALRYLCGHLDALEVVLRSIARQQFTPRSTSHAMSTHHHLRNMRPYELSSSFAKQERGYRIDSLGKQAL